ncbi:Ctf8-domain-containing protein [Dendryphion nanum]|uniref:Ctf8-domain-containing protein n=1 Tax=Dendryphion nanum TaxID=256645 RepID=A0A9P9IJ86_9PLEO|nr:Ctf8-domain-containing protein [Dendryphion nanum]
MPVVPVHPPDSTKSASENPLPPLLHTPAGLAILELQGTIHFPTAGTNDSSSSTLVGKLSFPLYNPEAASSDTSWMKKIYLYVGQNQRMAGQCKKLGKPFAVIRRRINVDDNDRVGSSGDIDMGGVEGENVGGEELEIVEIVRYKIVFSTRPEPVSRGVGEEEEEEEADTEPI